MTPPADPDGIAALLEALRVWVITDLGTERGYVAHITTDDLTRRLGDFLRLNLASGVSGVPAESRLRDILANDIECLPTMIVEDAETEREITTVSLTAVLDIVRGLVAPRDVAPRLREELEWLRGSQDSIGRFNRSPNGGVVRLDDVLAVLRLAHTWPPDALADGRGVCADCGAFWPCAYAVEAGSALRSALSSAASSTEPREAQDAYDASLPDEDGLFATPHKILGSSK
jgi:hypothetical protein